MARSVFVFIIIASFLLPANRSFAGFRLNRGHQPATAYLQNNQLFQQNLLPIPDFFRQRVGSPLQLGFWHRDSKEMRRQSRISRLAFGLDMAGFCSLYAFAYYALAAGAATDAVASVILPGLFFGLMVSGLVVGLIALGSKQKRKGYAIAAIVISLLTMLAAVASLL